MKRILPILILIALLIGVLAITAWPGASVQALPEYSAQTGEPCASCHISPSGGGSRGPRGQAWVGSGKPGAVPDLVAALEVLGVHLDVDPAAFTTVPGEIVPAAPLQLQPEQRTTLHRWLSQYGGN